MRIECFSVGAMQENAYLLTDEETGKCAVVDPGAPDAALLRAIRQNGKLEAILLTHGHFDHIGAVEMLRNETGAKVVAHAWEQPLLQSEAKNLSTLFGSRCAFSADETVEDGDSVWIGSTELQVIHTPGHTQGCVCYRHGDVLLTGDTLFEGSIGRTDFPTGDAATLMVSLKKLAQLPGEFRVLAGHGGETTLETERKTNPYMTRMNFNDFDL